MTSGNGQASGNRTRVTDLTPEEQEDARFIEEVTNGGKPGWPAPLGPDAYHGLVGDITRAIEPHTESDPAAVLIQSLVAYGSIIGHSAHWKADGAQHFCNLYAVVVGQTSKGRKGTSWANVRGIYSKVDPLWADTRICSGLSSGEGLIWAVRDPISRQVAIKEKNRHTGEYETVIEDQGIADKRAMVVESEFANVLKVAQREGNTLSPVVRQAWDTGNLRSMTKNSPAVATDAHVSIIGHITADELKRNLDRTETCNGLGNRFLWVCAKRSKCLPDGGRLYEVDLSDIICRMTLAVDNGKEATLVTRDAEARALWHEVYPKLSEGYPGLAGSLLGRAEAQVMRLATAYALMDGQRVVRLPHLRAGLEVWRYCEESVFYIFGRSSGDPLADELESILVEHPDGLTRTELFGAFGRHVEGEKLTRALLSLQQQGKAHMVKVKGAGRHAERWFSGEGVPEYGNDVPCDRDPTPDDLAFLRERGAL